jgi:hypothetical protein
MNKHFNTIALLFQQRNILAMNLQKRLLSISNFIILTLILAFSTNLQAQVGIAATSITADASAMLEVILAFDYEMKIVKLSGYVVSRFAEMRKPGVKISLQNKTNGE